MIGVRRIEPIQLIIHQAAPSSLMPLKPYGRSRGSKLWIERLG